METKVSFVILSHNDAEMVTNAVKSIKKLKTKHRFDIFVVDNGSKDNTPELVKLAFKDIKIIKLPKNIGTAAYDKAIKKSKSKYIYFSGCDIEVKEDMFDKLVDFLEKNKEVVQATPKYISLKVKNKIDFGGTWLSRSFYSGIFKDDTLGNKNIEIPYTGTGLIRTEFINRFGYLFDNDYFFYGEDVELGLRIKLMGYKIFYIPNSIIYHQGSISRKVHKPHFLTYLMERNLLTTFFKTLSVKNILLFAPYVFFMRFIAIIKDLFTLKLANIFARIKAILWVIFNLNKILIKRKKIQKMRKVNDKRLFELFSEKYLLRI